MSSWPGIERAAAPRARRHRWPAFAAALLLLCMAGDAVAQRLSVRAVDQFSGVGIAEAVLTLTHEGRREVGDSTGWIQFYNIEPGVHEAVLTAPGYRGRRLRLQLPDDSPALPMEVFLSPVVHELQAFEVSTVLADEDHDAIAARGSVAPMDQLSGEALRDITADGMAETLEKVAGVTVSTEDGAVAGISIRGAGARQTRVTLDGQSVGGGGGRGTTRGAGAMNQIPREFLERVQIMKAPTPDMDADAIGGSVDFQTSRVANRRETRRSLSLRSNYNEAGGNWGHRLNLAHAQPFQLSHDQRRMGLLVAANADTADSSADDLRILNQWPLRTSPETGEQVPLLARFRAGTRDSTSSSHGLVVNTDLQLNQRNHLQLKTLWSGRDHTQAAAFHTTEFIRGRIVSLLPQSGEFQNLRMEKQFLERRQRDHTASVVLGAEHLLGDWKIEESAGYSSATTRALGTRNAIFRTGPGFDGRYDLAPDPALPAVAVSQGGLDLSADDLSAPDPYQFVRYDLIDDLADDAELSVRVNAERQWESARARWSFKGGLKTRMRDASQDQDKLRHYPAAAPFSLAEVADDGPAAVFGGRYAIGPSWSAAAMAARFEADPGYYIVEPSEALLDASASDFSVSESIHSAYAMARREGEKWTFVGGLRLERTETETRGYETTTQTGDDRQKLAEVRPVTLRDSYDKLFPGLHFLYRASPAWIVRSSLTRTLQRPDFRDLSPSTRVNLDARHIRSGNPELEPFDAKAVDLGTDFVINQWASASVGLFYKRIDDFIVDVVREASYQGEPGFTQSLPVNGSPADLLGVEAAFNATLAFLPGALERTDLSLNYTLTDSSAVYPGFPDTIIMLPEQVRETLNVSLRWRFENWTVSVRTRYRGLQLRELIRPGQDQFNAGAWSHSLSVSYKLNDSVDFSLGVANLNRPNQVSYQGEPLRTLGNRAVNRSFSMGLNIRFGRSNMAARARGSDGG